MMRKALLAALVCTVVLLGSPASTYAAASDAVVSGTLTGTGGPIAGATVTVEYLAKGGLPKRMTTLTTASDGTWTYVGKAGTDRFTFSADGYYARTELLNTASKGTYVLDVTLAPVPPPAGTITGRIYGSTGSGLFGYVYFFKQNADGSWPTGYIWQVATATDGTYSSGPLPLGIYAVRLFTVHTGVQWYQYASTIESATPVVLDTDGQVVSGIDARFPPP